MKMLLQHSVKVKDIFREMLYMVNMIMFLFWHKSMKKKGSP